VALGAALGGQLRALRGGQIAGDQLSPFAVHQLYDQVSPPALTFC